MSMDVQLCYQHDSQHLWISYYAIISDNYVYLSGIIEFFQEAEDYQRMSRFSRQIRYDIL
jgi:hypothetical protein